MWPLDATEEQKKISQKADSIRKIAEQNTKAIERILNKEHKLKDGHEIKKVATLTIATIDHFMSANGKMLKSFLKAQKVPISNGIKKQNWHSLHTKTKPSW